MTLKERLQLKAAREGKEHGQKVCKRKFERLPPHFISGERKEWNGQSDFESSSAYKFGHASTHEMIAKLAGALERSREWISIARYKMLDVDNHPANLVQKLNDEALQELEKWLGENG